MTLLVQSSPAWRRSVDLEKNRGLWAHTNRSVSLQIRLHVWVVNRDKGGDKVSSFFKYFVTTVLLISFYAPVVRAQAKKGAGNPSTSASSSTAPSASPSSTAAIESQMLAFGAVDKIAGALAAKVQSFAGDNAPIVIYDQTAFATLQSYQAFAANVKVLVGAYQTLITDKAAALQQLTQVAHKRELVSRAKAKRLRGGKNRDANSKQLPEDRAADNDRKQEDQYHTFAVTGPAFGDPISDATSLLSAIAISANTETPGAITIPDSVMAVAVTRELKKLNSARTIIYPPLFGKGSSTDFASADIQADIQVVDDFRELAHADVDEANKKYIKDNPAKPAVPGVGGGPGTPASQGVSGDTVLTSALTDIDGLYDSFINSLLQVNSSTGVIGSASVIQGYQLAQLLAGSEEILAKPEDADHEAIPGRPAEPPAYVLLASFVGAGGTEHDHKSFWTALGTGDKITYSGGAIVNVALWRATSSAPLYADVLRYRAPFSEMNPMPGSGVQGVASGDNWSK
jgi:hypothetical protein